MDSEVTKMNVPVNLVDRVRAALAGDPNNIDKKLQKDAGKIDGITKAFRTTIRRIEARRNKSKSKK